MTKKKKNTVERKKGKGRINVGKLTKPVKDLTSGEQQEVRGGARITNVRANAMQLGTSSDPAIN